MQSMRLMAIYGPEMSYMPAVAGYLERWLEDDDYRFMCCKSLST